MLDEKVQFYMDLRYEIIVEPAEDGYVAYIPELNGCITQADDIHDIFDMLLDAKKCWIETALENGIEIPLPKSAKSYSGKFNLRLPKTLHKRLSEKAQKEEVSINQLAIYYIADGLARI